jgi:hypothetical protein
MLWSDTVDIRTHSLEAWLSHVSRLTSSRLTSTAAGFPPRSKTEQCRVLDLLTLVSIVSNLSWDAFQSVKYRGVIVLAEVLEYVTTGMDKTMPKCSLNWARRRFQLVLSSTAWSQLFVPAARCTRMNAACMES